jgi:hypothetical protein
MSKQGDLFADGMLRDGELKPIVEIPTAHPEGDLRNEPLDVRFERFHAMNPHVFTRLVEMAMHLRSRGFERCSAKMIVERLRWEVFLRTKGVDDYKINNSYTSFYARLIMATQPELEGFFEVRRQKGGYAPPLELVERARRML